MTTRRACDGRCRNATGSRERCTCVCGGAAHGRGPRQGSLPLEIAQGAAQCSASLASHWAPPGRPLLSEDELLRRVEGP